MIRALLLLLATSLPAAAQVAPGAGALLRGLDKIDGETADIPVGTGETVPFGRLEITLRECRFPERNPAGDAFASLVIQQGGERIFDGWMIASSPALHALDHPRYDVWLIACRTT